VIIYLNGPWTILTLSNGNCELTSWETTFITDSELYERAFARLRSTFVNCTSDRREAISLVIRVVCSVPRALVRLDPERIYRFALGNGVENFYGNRSFCKVSERSSIFLLARQCITVKEAPCRRFFFSRCVFDTFPAFQYARRFHVKPPWRIRSIFKKKSYLKRKSFCWK